MGARNSRWTPGMRPPKMQKQTGATNPRKRVVSASAHIVEAFVYLSQKDDEFIASECNQGLTPEIQEGDVTLTIGKRDDYCSIMLSNLREDELDVLQEAINYAFRKAKTISRTRDRVAREALKNGDNTYRRLHRGTPNISYIERKGGADEKELPK